MLSHSTLERWLAEHVVHDERVLSWANDGHPGYAYAEAAGLLVRWYAQRGIDAPPAVVARLRRDVERRAIGRGGSVYAFDTAVVLAGLEALDEREDPRWSLGRADLAQMPVVHPPAPARWSTLPGPHLLKLAVGCAARAARGWSTPSLAWLLQLGVHQEENGRIRTPPHEATYVHAHAYATEGMMALASLGHAPPASIDRAVEFLRAIQRDDGGLPAWSDGGPTRSDATAQAVRLFVLHDRTTHASAIERGLSCVQSMSNPAGAVRYEPDSEDWNTWCSLFANQARGWAEGEAARVEDLL